MMMRSVLIFLATFYLSSGCTEREFAPLDDLVLTCASDDDCPDNFCQQTRLDPPECLELANRDVEALASKKEVYCQQLPKKGPSYMLTSLLASLFRPMASRFFWVTLPQVWLLKA